MARRTTVVAFPQAHEQSLSGRLEQPPGHVHASALFAPCLTCSKDSAATVRIAGAIHQRAPRPTSFVSLEGADRMPTRQDDAAYAAEILAPWASRHLDPARQPARPLAGEGGHAAPDDVLRPPPTTAA
ncbi:hypothetical protein [Streptomyces sp. CA-106110]|uniref:hypothetical protein n=1 Tax=Streptomyces sp. CA-106110 TaxID=3240044 RepID=UPI003D942CE8